MLAKTSLISISFIYGTQLSFAAYKESVRHTELANELSLRGVNIPTGAGVSVTQVEAPEATDEYVPNTTNSEFANVTIVDETGTGLTSSHATQVGLNLYGSSTSISPGISNVSVYSANDFINSGWFSGTPTTENNPLQNHSWVYWSASDQASLRMDYAANRDEFLPIAGLYNSDYGDQNIAYDIPDTYGSIYNGITVGVSDGTHRYGVTSYDGIGRTKPEIVAPSAYTSYATPMITSAAALLIESANEDSNALQPITLKAILLAGADKSISESWDQTTTRPIDEVYGAGELDIYESYFIQQAGQQVAGNSIDERGWNLSSVSSNSSDIYSINVPVGFELRNLSALITWNRTVTQTASRRGPSIQYTYTSTLANLSLSLTGNASQTSDSAVDNIEHIWRDSSHALASGDYTLTVASTSSTSTDYAIAWRSQLYQDYSLWTNASFTEATSTELRDADDDPDGDGIENLLEQAFGGDPEVNDISILPISETIEDNGQRYLQISYRKPNFENALTYTVETVTDLNDTWSSQNSEVELISIATESGNFDRYTYRRVEPISASDQAFLRVSITE
ncbi:hypothetical protein SH580_07685 [Coraliomargarita algicola]|uniref:Peptidase S8/S53 domain-containing protein n=1 Tax=Coraliomargarita algicola TaxID=3092156 RepID=A0ABZ0RMY8_9BACT|nr:hypothetical protein [Coraliomargarita sp. J2-16]WPJ97589.1 hypothetical protein SH580_07685 [Coraliomargarita sp. J2-16]